MGAPCQGYRKVLNGRKGDLWYGAVGGGSNPFLLEVNEEEIRCLAVKRDLQRLRKKTLSKNNDLMTSS
jgi:hypothetical protein